LEVVEELLKARSPTLVNARADEGTTALRLAVNNNLIPCAKALLAAGADPNIAEDDGITPLMVAEDAEMARCLLDAGADVNARSHQGDTALLIAAESGNDASFVALLLERGADANAVSEDGYSALMSAVSEGYMDVLKVLLAADPPADVNLQNDEGQTALFRSTDDGNLVAMKLLLDAGANPHIASSNGEIPLMHCKAPESVKMLVDAAPDTVNHTCGEGRTAISYLTSFPLLEELFASCARLNIQIDVNHRDEDGDTALHVAMMEVAGLSAVKLLLDNGADVFVVDSDDTTVLMMPFFTDEDEEHTDSTIRDCLKALLDHVLSLDVTAPMHVASNGTNHALEGQHSHTAKPLKR
jgi:ankyrin repeat protein